MQEQKHALLVVQLSGMLTPMMVSHVVTFKEIFLHSFLSLQSVKKSIGYLI